MAKKHISAVVISGWVLFGLVASAQERREEAQGEKTAEQAFKNIQVLKGEVQETRGSRRAVIYFTRA